MKNFRVHIHYDGFLAQTNVTAEDNVESIEKSILDKLGRNEIKFINDGFTRGKWITYEEVINDRRPVQYKTVLGVKLATGTPEVREA
tara:strand:+ start:64 stop:324 length:261 start_codon:yes stop_codon:yes gene_type:complete